VKLKIKVPASSANLGPGFDALGIALGLYNEIAIKTSNFHSISIKGEGEHNNRLKKNNIFISIFNDIYQELNGHRGTFRFEFTNKIPFARGLGSSSAVIVSAIASAYEMSNVKVSKNKILNRALFYEPHPDNIAPCVYGGFVSSVVDNNKVYSLRKTLPQNLKVVMVIPNRPMSTMQSRSQLPKKFAMGQVVYNLSRASLLSAAFFSENWEVLKIASKDCIHQDKRMKNMPELKQVQKRALEQGALMSTLSGSGSSFFSMCYETDALGIKEALQREFSDFRVEILDFDNIGYVVEKND